MFRTKTDLKNGRHRKTENPDACIFKKDVVLLYLSNYFLKQSLNLKPTMTDTYVAPTSFVKLKLKKRVG